MTGPEDSHSNTRPISVAELLAKNGTIGAPPVGGRRRKHRGNSDSVTVAELTGEIPILSAHDVHDVDDAVTSHRRAVVEDEHVDATGPVPTTNGVAGHVDEVEPESAVERGLKAEGAADEYTDDDDDYAGAVADYTAHLEQRDVEPDPVDFFAPPPRRPQYTPAPRRFGGPAGRSAEQMSPDPVDDDELFDSSVGLAEAPEIEDEDTEAAVGEKAKREPPSYLRSTAGPLFGGQTVADDLARRGPPPSPEKIHLGYDDDTDTAPSAMSSFLRAAWVVGQCIIAVAFGAGLFIAFDQLWKWNNIVALVLSVLVILGLVVGVRVVRKTEDIGSTLIAVAVGALVTLGPLALLQSG
jgi:hypothetical protein